MDRIGEDRQGRECGQGLDDADLAPLIRRALQEQVRGQAPSAHVWLRIQRALRTPPAAARAYGAARLVTVMATVIVVAVAGMASYLQYAYVIEGSEAVTPIVPLTAVAEPVPTAGVLLHEVEPVAVVEPAAAPSALVQPPPSPAQPAPPLPQSVSAAPMPAPAVAPPSRPVIEPAVRQAIREIALQSASSAVRAVRGSYNPEMVMPEKRSTRDSGPALAPVGAPTPVPVPGGPPVAL